MSILEERDPVRVVRARRMTEDANRLAATGSSDSAIILYVTALEMLGEALLRHLGLHDHLPKPLRRYMHKTRHFVAATLLLGHLSRRQTSAALADLDFSSVSFEQRGKQRDGTSGVYWHPVGKAGPALEILQVLAAPWPLPAGTPEQIIRMKVLMQFWGNSAMGFCDNHRISLIHQDNSFDFTYHTSDGNFISTKNLLVDDTAEYYEGILCVIWESSKDNNALRFLSIHMLPLLDTFLPILASSTYNKHNSKGEFSE